MVYDSFSFSIVVIDNEPWFVGKDVAWCLRYKEPQKAIRERVDEEDRGVSKLDTPGGNQTVVVINESGLYSLIMSSKLPTAKAFKRWVTKFLNGLFAIRTLCYSENRECKSGLSMPGVKIPDGVVVPIFAACLFDYALWFRKDCRPHYLESEKMPWKNLINCPR